MPGRIEGGRVPGWLYGLGVFAAGYGGWTSLQSGEIVRCVICWALGAWIFWMFVRQISSGKKS